MTTRQPAPAGPADGVTAGDVKAFWEAHPVCAGGIAAAPGTPEFYAAFDSMREIEETPAFGRRFYGYDRSAGLRVLDVGCGNGHVLERYARGGAIVLGVDLTGTATGLTRRRFELAGLPAPALAEASAEALPFESDSFDAVTCMGVVHHTPDDRGAIRELIRVLRPGGRLRLMVYHRDSAQYRLTFPLVRRLSRRLRGWRTQDLVNYVDGAGNPLGRVYGRGDMAALLPGCRIISMEAGALRGTLPRIRALPDPAALLPAAVERALARRVGWCLYVSAVKCGGAP